jgi:hypothetical protein
VNDLGVSPDGDGMSLGPAQEVVEEIKAFGGKAVANGDSITDSKQAEGMVQQAVDTLLDVGQTIALVFRHEGKSDPGSAHPPSSSDSVYVVVDFVWQIEVNDVGNGRNINPSADDIGSHQDIEFLFTQGSKDRISLRLAHIAMDCPQSHCAIRLACEVILKPSMQLRRPDFGAAKNDRLGWFFTFQKFEQRIHSLLGCDANETLLDRLDSDIFIGAIDHYRLEQVAVCKLANPFVQSGAEQQCLAILWAATQDLLNARTETDIEHPVRLVEDHTPQSVQPQRTSLNVIDHTPRCSDYHLHALFQGRQLATHVLAP